MTSDLTRPSGLDLQYLDDSVRVQDDLFRHVNGVWLDEHVIPADRSSDGAFMALRDQAEAQVRVIIEDAAGGSPEPGTDAQRIGDLYASFMDTAAVEAAGVTPIAGELAAIRAAADRDALARLLGELSRVGVGGPIGKYVDNDDKDASRYLLYFTQSGIGLPDEAYYREDTHAATRTAYRAHIAAMLELAAPAAGELAADPAATADTIFALEAKLAGAHWDVVRRRDVEASYNLVTFADIVAEHPGFAWEAWVAGFGGTGKFTEVVVRQPDYLAAFATLWASEPLETWKAWASWRVIRSRASLLTAAIVDQEFSFSGKTLTGAEQLRERWKRGVGVVQSLLGEAVGKLYVAKHFPPAAKDRMVELVANLQEAYRQSISSLDWMSAETRSAALEKLEKFTPKIGYPEQWRDYSNITIVPGHLVDNYRNGYAAEFDRDINKLGGPVDRGEWFMTPQTVNAYYNPGMNEIVFPAAILQPPFFDAEADDAANYGGIGAVIGHEIGHGFDDQGAKFDGDGNLKDWWTDADRDEFASRTKALIAQYAVLEPREVPGHTVNGELTVGENIGDLGGISIAIKAYQIALGGDDAPIIDGLTGLQRIFYSWGIIWRSKSRREQALNLLKVDPHSPPEFRCNSVIRNLDSFHEAFDVQPGDGLYLEPEQRVRIW